MVNHSDYHLRYTSCYLPPKNIVILKTGIAGATCTEINGIALEKVVLL